MQGGGENPAYVDSGSFLSQIYGNRVQQSSIQYSIENCMKQMGQGSVQSMDNPLVFF